jgi:hypothetical protein
MSVQNMPASFVPAQLASSLLVLLQERVFVYQGPQDGDGMPFNEAGFLAYTKTAKVAVAAGMQAPTPVSPLPLLQRRRLLIKVCAAAAT